MASVDNVASALENSPGKPTNEVKNRCTLCLRSAFGFRNGSREPNACAAERTGRETELRIFRIHRRKSRPLGGLSDPT
jgi:hypothetical protein